MKAISNATLTKGNKKSKIQNVKSIIVMNYRQSKWRCVKKLAFFLTVKHTSG